MLERHLHFTHGPAWVHLERRHHPLLGLLVEDEARLGPHREPLSHEAVVHGPEVPDCDGVGDIVGTYTGSGFDIFRVPGPPLTDVSMTMEVTGRDGCTFWGHTGDGRSSLGNIPDDGMPLLGLIRSYELEFDLADPIGTRRELSTASIIQMSHVCVNSSAIDPYGRGGEVCVNTSAVVKQSEKVSVAWVIKPGT